jgi:hypothetical protein
MKLAVVGTRSFKDKSFVYKQIKNLINSGIKITQIISGGATGPDRFGKEFAEENKIPFILFEADWSDLKEPCFIKINDKGEKYNALAGFKRNNQIVENCTVMLAFWDGKSQGTKDVIAKANLMNKKVITVKI